MFHCLPNYAWADGNVAEAAGQLGKMVEHPNPSQPKPGPRADGTLCSCALALVLRRGERAAFLLPAAKPRRSMDGKPPPPSGEIESLEAFRG